MSEQQNLKRQAKLAVYWSFFNNFSTQIFQFFIGLILARLLSPSDYGILAMPMVFLAVANCFIYSGFGAALIRKPDLKEEDISTAFYFNIIVGIFFYILLYFASPLIADFYNVPILTKTLRVTSLSMILGPLQSVHYSLFSRNLQFNITAKISIASSIITGLVGVSMAYMGFGIWALVFQGVAGHLLSVCLVWYFSSWRPRTGWSNDSFRYLFGFGSKMLVSGIMDTLYDNIIPIFVGKFYSPTDLGIFNRGKNYAVLPQSQISGMLNRVSFPVLSKLQEDERRLYEYFRKMIRLVIFVLSPIELLIAALARPLILVMITDKWEASIIVLQLMCFAVMLWPIQSLNMALFKVKGRSDLVLKANVVIKCMLLVVMAATLPFGIKAICIGSIIRAILAITWISYYAGKFSAFGIKEQFKQIIPSIALSLTMFFLVSFVISLFDSLYLQLIIGSTIGVLYYLGLSYRLKFSELNELAYLLHFKKK